MRAGSAEKPAEGFTSTDLAFWKSTAQPASLLPALCMDHPRQQHDTWIYVLGVILGISAGILDVWLGDLLLTALFVMISTMLLAVLRPVKPWRWILLVGTFVPVIELLAYLFLTERPYAAQIYESFLGFLTGTAGAYAGSVMRRAVAEIFPSTKSG